VDWKLELVLVPVSDMDRAKAFYTEKAGFDLDLDHRVGEEFRVVQLTPPGSACSVSVGTGITDAAPGSARGLHLVVSDIDAARRARRTRGGRQGGQARRVGQVGVGRGPATPKLQLVRPLQRPGRQ
jgi:catechol 2,3-dioxygenase-like lactoylglutathione lyase family enzyme